MLTLLSVLFVSLLTVPTTALAFDQTWFFTVSTQELDCILWDDVPGAGVNNEAGLFLFEALDAADESCTWRTAVGFIAPPLSTLQVRAAVNDGASLTLELRGGVGFEFPCLDDDLITSMTFAGSEAHSGFITKTMSIPAGADVRTLCVRLDDNPDTAAERISALVDDIRIQHFCLRQSLVIPDRLAFAPPRGLTKVKPEFFFSNCIDWRERFSGGAP